MTSLACTEKIGRNGPPTKGIGAATCLRLHACELSIRPLWVACGLFSIALLLSLVSPIVATIAHSLPEHQRGLIAVLGKFNVNNEINLPAWYSSSALLVASALLATIASVRRRMPWGDFLQWAVLAVIFLGLSADESATFHEVLIVPIRRRLDLHGPLYFAWVLPGLAFALAVGLAYRGFLRRLDRRTRSLFVASACLYLGGALGMEMVGGWLSETVGQKDVCYVAATTIEEFLEMSGVALFIYALLDLLARQHGRISVTFAATSTQPNSDLDEVPS